VKRFTVKVNGKEFFFDDVETALDLVEVTYFSCRVVFAEDSWKTGKVINTSVDFSELCDMY
jgi:hypothetical protein